MSAHSSDTRELREDEDDGATGGTGAKRAASTVASLNGNGRLSLLAGGVLLARAVRSFRKSRSNTRPLLAGLAGAGLLAVGIRQRRSGGSETDETKQEDDEAAAPREQSGVLNQSETNPRGTSGEPDVEVENRDGDVEFTEEQDIGPSHQPDLEDEAGVEDPRRDQGDETEVDLSEAAMADEASEAVGPSTTQAQPAQTDTVEPERTSEEDSQELQQRNRTDEEPDPDADPGEATEEAAEADPANVADEIIDGEIDDEEREGVETEGGATVHTDTNESDDMDIDVDDVTDPGDDLHQETAGSEDSGSHLDEDPPDEDEEE
jgi:hypothetical protein